MKIHRIQCITFLLHNPGNNLDTLMLEHPDTLAVNLGIGIIGTDIYGTNTGINDS